MAKPIWGNPGCTIDHRTADAANRCDTRLRAQFTGGIIPGWYPNGPSLRWWDGHRWTPATRPYPQPPKSPWRLR